MTDSFDKALAEAGELVNNVATKGGNVRVVSHYDADGLSAASLFTKFLVERGVTFQVKFVEQIYPPLLDEIPFDEYDLSVFLDLGSGYKDQILSKIKKGSILIFDHHIPEKEVKRKDFVEINPYFFEIDASTQISAAGVVYLFYGKHSLSARELVHLAIVGALGDRQDVGPKFSLVGYNRDILSEAQSYGIVEEKIGLRLFGILYRPIVRALAYTMDPYIPGLSGNEAACFNFLKKIGIEPKDGDKLRDYKSLSQEEIKTLATELIKYLLMNGVPLQEAERIFGYNYYFLREVESSPLRDLREYAYIMNALGRLEYYETAIALNIGKRGAFLVRALDAVREYKRILSRILEKIRDNMDKLAKLGKNAVILDLQGLASPKITGPISTILSTTLANRFKGAKIIGVMTDFDDKHVKISFRRLADSIDVGRYLKAVSQKLDCIGGGHPAAGGIFIEKKKIPELYKYL